MKSNPDSYFAGTIMLTCVLSISCLPREFVTVTRTLVLTFTAFFFSASRTNFFGLKRTLQVYNHYLPSLFFPKKDYLKLLCLPAAKKGNVFFSVIKNNYNRNLNDYILFSSIYFSFQTLTLQRRLSSVKKHQKRENIIQNNTISETICLL